MDENDFNQLCLAILDDDFGTNERAYDKLCEIGHELGYDDSLNKIVSAVRCQDDRYYIPTLQESIFDA